MKVVARVLHLLPDGSKRTGIGWLEFYEIELPQGMPLTLDNVRDAVADQHGNRLTVIWALESVYVQRPEDLPNHG